MCRHFNRTECADASPATNTCSASNPKTHTGADTIQWLLHMGWGLWRLRRRWYWLVPYVGIELCDMHWELRCVRVPPILRLPHDTCANDSFADACAHHSSHDSSYARQPHTHAIDTQSDTHSDTTANNWPANTCARKVLLE